MTLGQSGKRAIAEQLYLSVKTVEVHRANIKAKLKLKAAPELICYAVRWAESSGGPGKKSVAFGKLGRDNPGLRCKLWLMSTMLITYRNPGLLASVESLSRAVVAESASLKPQPAFLPKPVYSIDSIHRRAETMTGLLEEILAIHPEPHWGINE